MVWMSTGRRTVRAASGAGVAQRRNRPMICLALDDSCRRRTRRRVPPSYPKGSFADATRWAPSTWRPPAQVQPVAGSSSMAPAGSEPVEAAASAKRTASKSPGCEPEWLRLRSRSGRMPRPDHERDPCSAGSRRAGPRRGEPVFPTGSFSRSQGKCPGPQARRPPGWNRRRGPSFRNRQPRAHARGPATPRGRGSSPSPLQRDCCARISGVDMPRMPPVRAMRSSSRRRCEDNDLGGGPTGWVQG